MFCAIATTIERCKTEGVVDVFQVVKALRVQKPGAVANVVSRMSFILCLQQILGDFDISLFQMQYKTIFDAISAYLDSRSNF